VSSSTQTRDSKRIGCCSIINLQALVNVMRATSPIGLLEQWYLLKEVQSLQRKLGSKPICRLESIQIMEIP